MKRRAASRASSKASKSSKSTRRYNAPAKIPSWYRGASFSDVARHSTEGIKRWLSWADRDGDFDDIKARWEALLVLAYQFEMLPSNMTVDESTAFGKRLVKVYPAPRPKAR
jgi:hypothetical protein